MKTNKLIALFIGASLPFSACREAGPDLPEADARYVDVTVTLGREDEAEDGTRSIVDIEVENFQKAALFAFDAKTGTILTYTPGSGGQPGEPVAAFPRQKNFSWSLPTGVSMDIYAIVNFGDLDLASYARPGLKKAELEALRFTSRNPSELKRLETEGYGMPMAGVKEGVFLTSPGDGLEIPVKKLYAKYNLWFDLSRIEQEGWHVQAMHIIVENANTEVPFFVENYRQDDPSKLVEYDRATEHDLDEIQQGGSGHAVTLYMLENCQGHKEGAESWKTVYKDLGFEALRNCTYIDLSVKVNRSGGEYQNLGYAIYLGKTDMRSDFDIVRNLFKTIRIVLPGPDDPNPASHFFKFSGTESPSVMPGESIDLYFVTNLPQEDISASCSPSGRLSVTSITYAADEDGIATGSVRLQASETLQEGMTCLVTAGSAAKSAVDQRTVTASWPTTLDVILTQAPGYVAQTGYLQVVPRGGIVRVDAEVKAGSEEILEVREAGVSGSLMNIGLAGLSAGTGTVILHHFNAAGVETGSQEVEIPIQAPLLRFGTDLYTLPPDGEAIEGSLQYYRADGTGFTNAEKKTFDLELIKQLLFPVDWLWVTGCGAFVEANILRKRDDELLRLTVPIILQVKRLHAGGRELPMESGIIGSVTYEGAPSAKISYAQADLALLNPFASTAGTSLGVIDNNLPVYEALTAEQAYLQVTGIEAAAALRLTSYRNGKTFTINGATPSLELPLPFKTDLSYEVAGPEEFTIEGLRDKLVLTAVEHPASYTGYGRFPLKARIIHAVTGERSAPVDMGYLEIYLIGALGPYIHADNPGYQVGGTVVPAGARSPIEALLSPIVHIREKVAVTSLSGYYKSEAGSTYNLYHQSVEIDDHGIDRYASEGETSYLNSYQIRTGSFPLGTDVMMFSFGSIWRGHGAGLVEAALESRGMLEAWFSEGYPNGKLRHFPRATEKDASGFSYCAVANLFGGNGFSVYDVFLETRE